MSTLLYVDFADETEAVIVTQYGSPQPAEGHPYGGTVTTSDPRWLTFYNNFPEIMRQNLPTPTTD